MSITLLNGEMISWTFFCEMDGIASASFVMFDVKDGTSENVLDDLSDNPLAKKSVSPLYQQLPFFVCLLMCVKSINLHP